MGKKIVTIRVDEVLLDYLEKSNKTIVEYIIQELIINSQNTLLQEFLDKGLIDDTTIQTMIDKDIIQLSIPSNGLDLNEDNTTISKVSAFTVSAINVYKEEWKVFIDVFPKTDGWGNYPASRSLVMSKDRAFLHYTKGREKYSSEEMLIALKNEIGAKVLASFTKGTNEMMYFSSLPTYMLNHRYEAFIGDFEFADQYNKYISLKSNKQSADKIVDNNAEIDLTDFV